MRKQLNCVISESYLHLFANFSSSVMFANNWDWLEGENNWDYCDWSKEVKIVVIIVFYWYWEESAPGKLLIRVEKERQLCLFASLSHLSKSSLEISQRFQSKYVKDLNLNLYWTEQHNCCYNCHIIEGWDGGPPLVVVFGVDATNPLLGVDRPQDCTSYQWWVEIQWNAGLTLLQCSCSVNLVQVKCAANLSNVVAGSTK